MGRTLTTAMSNAISAKEGYADIWLLEIAGSGGTIRYTTAPSNVAYDSQTWTGIGGVIDFEPPPETADPAGQSCRISLSGVDTTVIAEILNNNVRGRDCKLYWGQLDIAAGTIVADAIEAFAGLMNSGWSIEHTPSDPGSPGTVRVTTTIVSQLARYLFPRQVRTNVNSLLEMQARSSRDIYTPPGGEEADVFFQTIPAIVGQNVYWGRKGAAPIYTGKVVDTKEGPFY
tara:strand:- start:4416 stop:5102 length:687 start_codon:yes stop_codon:yes gene_type:complete